MDLKEVLREQLFADRYKLQRLIGSGGMGEVYLAHDTILGDEDIALKILKDDIQSDERHVQRFIREVQLTRKVNHPNVIRTFDVGVWKNRLFLSMEYLEATPISEMLQDGPLDFKEACNLLIQICHGLDAIHAQGIIHRDLKLANLLVDKSGVLKIADFGVARPSSSELTEHSEIIGSSHYMAPEVWSGAEASSACDLYALGVVAYELITGCLPFDGESPAELMWKHIQENPVSPLELGVDIPEWLSQLILILLEKDPQNRPCKAAEIANYIQVRLDGDTLFAVHDPLSKIASYDSTAIDSNELKETEEREDHLLGPLVSNPPEDHENQQATNTPSRVTIPNKQRETELSDIVHDHRIGLRNKVRGESKTIEHSSKFVSALKNFSVAVVVTFCIWFLSFVALGEFSLSLRNKLIAGSAQFEFLSFFLSVIVSVFIMFSLPILFCLLCSGNKARNFWIWSSGIVLLSLTLTIGMLVELYVTGTESLFLKDFIEGNFQLALGNFKQTLNTLGSAVLLSPTLDGRTLQTSSTLFWVILLSWSFFLASMANETIGNQTRKAAFFLSVGTVVFTALITLIATVIIIEWGATINHAHLTWSPGRYELNISWLTPLIYFLQLGTIGIIPLVIKKITHLPSEKSTRTTSI